MTERTDVGRAIGDVEHEFGLMFNRVRGLMRERALQVHPDLQPLAYKVLSALVRCDRMHAGRIGELLMTDKSTISRTVRQLEKLGLVAREADPDDGRACYLVASPLGMESVSRVRSADKEAMRSRLSGWDAEEISTLATLLNKLNATV